MSKSPQITYLNNSATSFPKPGRVGTAMKEAMDTLPGMTGRGEEEASAKDRVQHARLRLARFLGCSRPEQIVFTSNSSDSLNLAIHGWVDANYDGQPLRIVTTSNDHNSVLRPLETLKHSGKVEMIIVPCHEDGRYDMDAIMAALVPGTSMLAINHLSNVVGTIAPLAMIGEECRRRGIISLIDASQSAGLLDIDVEAMSLDMVAVTGHKYMFGPTGIGALYIHPDVKILPRKQGGTGVKSEEPLQPQEMPILFEAGTVNYHGIVALDVAREFIEEQGLESLRRKAIDMRRQCEERLAGIDGIELFIPGGPEERGAVVSFRVSGHQVADVDMLLRSRFGIIVRSGLHCAPLCHQRLGTFPHGTLRASFSGLTDAGSIEVLAEALEQIVRA